MELSIQSIVTIVLATGSGVAALLAHATYFGSKYGKMNTKIDEVKSDIAEVKDNVDELNRKVELTVRESFDNFVHKSTCEHININHTTELRGILEKQSLREEHNREEHARMIDLHHQMMQMLKEKQKADDLAFDAITDCLHKIQNNMKC